MHTLVVVSVMVVTASSASADPTAVEIVRDVIAIYAGATTYKDTGTVTTAIRGRTVVEQRFTTAFVRGDRFSFGLLRPARGALEPYAIWSNGAQTLAGSPTQPDDTHRALGDALGAAATRSNGATSAIPPLLMPNESGAHAHSLSSMSLMGTEIIDDHACWHLARGDFALWVDRDSHLVRKRTEQRGDTLTTLELDPSVDTPIAEQLLRDPFADPEPPAKSDLKVMESSPLIGAAAPDFAAERVSGPYPARLDELQGHIVVLEFWAAWCPPCTEAADDLNHLDRTLASEGVRTIAVSSEVTATIKQFRAAHHVRYTLAQDGGAQIARRYHVSAIPTFVVIDGAGIVRDVLVGDVPGAIEAAVKKLVTP